MTLRPSPTASFATTFRVELSNVPGSLARMLGTIGDAGGMLGAIDIVRMRKEVSIRDVTVDASDAVHVEAIREAIESLPGVRVIHVSDMTFLLHLGGKIEIVPKVPIRNRNDLSMAYTPGVARISSAIADSPEDSFNLTIRSNTVAVVSDGSAVLGLGDIGPEAAMPVMEGKAVLFKQFGGVDAFPLCLATKDVEEIIAIVTAVAPTFGGINLEDISSPRCFEIEERLRNSLDIPVFHDDQHGTAVVVLAAMLNAAKVTGKTLEDLRIVILGVGAAGMACARMLMTAGVKSIIGVDRKGVVHRGRSDLDVHKRWLAEATDPAAGLSGLEDALRGSDVLLGLSGPGTISPDSLALMKPDPIVFAMANPIPEIMPEYIEGRVGVMATGRSDYPNQINNVLCFPGLFRGALACRARAINEEMKFAAARSIASIIPEEHLTPDYIIPSVFDARVAEAVAAAVIDSAQETGVARRRPAEGPADLRIGDPLEGSDG